MLKKLIIACACVTVACASSPSSNDDLGAQLDANPCTPTSHALAACQISLGFAAGPAIPKASDHHATVVGTTATGAFLYVLGGNNYHGVFSTVYMAPILADGTLGAWTTTTPLPTVLAGEGVAVVKGRIIVVSGQNTNSFLPTVHSAPINADGTLGAWTAEPSLPEARFHSYVAVSGDSLYVTGGVDPSFNATTTNFRAPINSDGTLGAFVATTPFPVPRSHHVAIAHDGYLYVLAGLTGNPTTVSNDLAEILSAPINADGSLGAFSTIGMLSDPPATASGFELDGSLYLVGGLDDAGIYLSDIRRAPFAAGGMLGVFEAVMPGLPEGRSHVHQTPIYQNHFYSVGGSIDYEVTTTTVQVGTFLWDLNGPRSASIPAHVAKTANGPRHPHCPPRLLAR